tara:strand:+ start:813 stop:1091 length:279 start_codon:yes stop_codon:yes gene_type:complete
MNLKTNLNHNKIIAAVVFFQLAGRNPVATKSVINYTADAVVDNGLVHYLHDSYKIDCDSMYVEVGGVRYHGTDIPIPSKYLASFLNARNSIE